MSTRQFDRLVFFLEEPSAKDFLEVFVPLHFPKLLVQYITFEGKYDLEEQLESKLIGWRLPNTQFIVLRDQDSGDCKAIKLKLQGLCQKAKKPQTIIRIACRELESFFIGDWQAIADAFDQPNLAEFGAKAKFRVPDNFGAPSKELLSLIPNYRKGTGARQIAAHINPLRNTSTSFQVLYRTLTQLAN